MASSSTAALPPFTFGVVTDVQYASKPTKDVDGRVRAYADAAVKLGRAVDAFLAADAAQRSPPRWVVQLGDIIDGNDTAASTTADFEVVMREFARLEAGGVPVKHVVGNHCVALDRAELHRRLGLTAAAAAANGAAAYYSIREPGWRMVVLDAIDVSVLQAEDTPGHNAARTWLQANAALPNAMPWNGGLSDAQFAWLEAELAAATAAGERVLVLCHLPVVAEASEERHLLFDHARVRALLLATPAVVALFAGHYHPGGYARDGHVHHVTLQAILESPANSTAYGYVDVYPDRLVLRGHGSLVSRDLAAA